MQNINYGLIISDFDGTLVKADGSISSATKASIAEYRKAGGKFAISTGRLPEGILDRANELGLKGAVACCQGAVIVDIETRAVLFQGAIPNAVAVRICEKMEEMDLHIHVYDLWEYYCNKDDAALQYYQKMTGTKANLVLDRPMSAFLKEKGFDVYKFVTIVEAKDNERVKKALEAARFEGCGVTKSGENLVEVVNAKYSKGTAVDFLSDYYHVPIERTIAIGDQHNDVPMVEKAGFGIAVKNADERLKACADCVWEYTNEEDAVRTIIEKYGFSKDE